MASNPRQLAWLILCVALATVISGVAAHAIVYCNITEVTATQLSNGVQVTIQADGLLENAWSEDLHSDDPTGRYEVRFTNARNRTGENFIDVSMFPVSHIELSVPQDAREGVGVQMAIVMVEPSPVNFTRSNDRRSVIITVSSSRTLEEGEAAGSADAAESEAEITVEETDGLVSVTAVQADLHDLLGKIAQVTDANLAVDDAVEAQVSLHLRDLSVDQLLHAIASAYGLALAQVDGVYMFSSGVPQDLAAYRLSGTASFPLRYTRAEAASGLLPTFLYSYLHVNDEQNAIVVTAPQQMLDKIQSDLQAVDTAPPQILIEAIAVEFTNTEDRDRVLRMFRGDLLGGTDSEGIAVPPEYWGTVDSRGGNVEYANVGELPRDFEARLRALEMQQQAEILAAPRMAVMNGHQADIFIGVRRFIIVEFVSYGQTNERIQGVDVGVKLRVRPLTGGGGEITLNIEPDGTEVSNISELDPATGLPVLSTRRTGTTVRVQDGETVMIGGLSRQQSEDRVTSIPLLGDLPLIGSLFRSRSHTAINSELVVFITPHILTPEGRLPDEAEEQRVREHFDFPESPQ